MGYTLTPVKQKRLFFDLETRGNLAACALMDKPIVTAPSNYKDPAKIAEYIEVETVKRQAELIEKAALDPDLGTIVSIGMATSVDGPIAAILAGDIVKEKTTDAGDNPIEVEYVLTEADLLLTFWQNFAECRGSCVGYNILGFDLPFLLARSMYLGIRVPYFPVLAKFRAEPVTDLYGIRYNWGPGKGLKQECKLLGIPNDCPDIDGSKVASLTPDELRAYQTSDVKLVRELFKKMNGVYFSL